jgi:hypothetical protein
MDAAARRNRIPVDLGGGQRDVLKRPAPILPLFGGLCLMAGIGNGPFISMIQACLKTGENIVRFIREDAPPIARRLQFPAGQNPDAERTPDVLTGTFRFAVLRHGPPGLGPLQADIGIPALRTGAGIVPQNALHPFFDSLDPRVIHGKISRGDQ